MKQPFTENEWEKYAQSNNIIFTSCKDCVFFSSPDECSCGRLQKFQDNNVKIESVGAGERDFAYQEGHGERYLGSHEESGLGGGG